MKTLLRAAGLLALLLMVAGTARAIENSDCFACHSAKDLTKTDKAGQVVSLFVDEKEYEASIHGKNRCTSCHTDITEVPHPDGFTPKPVACSACHRLETEIYLKSDHGQAVASESEAASCKDCHGHSHTLLNFLNPLSPVNRANIPQTCGHCHGNSAEMAKFNLYQSAPVVTYDLTVHGLALKRGVTAAAVCTDCHGSHDLHKSTNPASKLYWQNIPDTCGKCHENVKNIYERSVHGKAVARGVRDAPVCTDCHGEHTIQAVTVASSKVSAAHIPETCGHCHGSVRIASQYQMSSKVVETMESFHGLVEQFGETTVANCASCHGFHDVLPPSDPLSSVNPKNLPQTCGKCHALVGTLMRGEIHNLPGAEKGKPWLVNFIALFFNVIIVLTIGGMLAFNALDYVAKTRAHLRKVRESADSEVLLSKWTRYQHLGVTILFIILAYTGFAHKYPDAFFSWPFKLLKNGEYMRGMIHRITGCAFAGLFFVQLVALCCTRPGRAHVKGLRFRFHDLKDGVGQLLYNIGLTKTPPPTRRWNYAQKAEYWALVGGSFVMIVTGAMLIFSETILRMLPNIWVDVAQVIHFYEALLATLAIVVWQFCWVIFHPNEVWFIGKKPAPGDPMQEHGAADENTKTE
ncbi:MAG: cytochrome b/b6 domain-containing protein [Desulfobaccales bacterium]